MSLSAEARRAKNRAQYLKFRERRLAGAKRYRDANRELIRQRQKTWHSRNKIHRRACQRRYSGLPEPLRPAPAGCECCGRPPGVYALALDHCHVTGRFRGWLCTQCNSGIGKLGDTEESLLQALRYLRNAAKLRAD